MAARTISIIKLARGACAALCCAPVVLLLGCTSMGTVAPGVSVVDTRTGKTVAHTRDASLEVGGPWGPHDAEALLPGRVTDKTFRTIYTASEGSWCVREFDSDGGLVATHVLPPVIPMHDLTEQYAISPGYDRVVFCARKRYDIRLYDVRKEKQTVLVKEAVTNPFSIKKMWWVGEESTAVLVGSLDEGPYAGTLLLVPLDGSSPRTLYKSLAFNCVAVSTDMTRLAITHSGKAPAPTRLVVVDLVDGSEELIGVFPHPASLFDMAWSPDGESLAYIRNMSVELYSLADKQTRVLKENPARKNGTVYGIQFLDEDRLAYCFDKSDLGRTWLEILDVRTGQVLVKRSFRGAYCWHVFDNGSRLALEGK